MTTSNWFLYIRNMKGLLIKKLQRMFYGDRVADLDDDVLSIILQREEISQIAYDYSESFEKHLAIVAEDVLNPQEQCWALWLECRPQLMFGLYDAQEAADTVPLPTNRTNSLIFKLWSQALEQVPDMDYDKFIIFFRSALIGLEDIQDLCRNELEISIEDWSILMLGSNSPYFIHRTDEEKAEIGCRIQALIDDILTSKLSIFATYLSMAQFAQLFRPLNGDELETAVIRTHAAFLAGTEVISSHSASYKKWKEEVNKLQSLIKQEYLTEPNYMEYVYDGFWYGRSQCQAGFFFYYILSRDDNGYYLFGDLLPLAINSPVQQAVFMEKVKNHKFGREFCLRYLEYCDKNEIKPVFPVEEILDISPDMENINKQWYPMSHIPMTDEHKERFYQLSALFDLLTKDGILSDSSQKRLFVYRFSGLCGPIDFNESIACGEKQVILACICLQLTGNYKVSKFFNKGSSFAAAGSREANAINTSKNLIAANNYLKKAGLLNEAGNKVASTDESSSTTCSTPNDAPGNSDEDPFKALERMWGNNNGKA